MEDVLVRVLFFGMMFLGAFSSVAFTAESSESKNEVAELQAKAVMNNVYNTYVKIIPYVYSTGNIFSDFKTKKKKEKEELLKNLTDLSLFFKSAKHAEFFSRPGFRPSLDTSINHLDQTILSLEADNFIFAQKRLNVIGALCVTCHTQLPESVSKNAFRDNIKKEKRDLFDSDFAYANYLYLVRRFDESKNYFEKAIEASLASANNTNKDIISSLRKILSIDTKIKFDYDKVRLFIEKWQKDSRLTNNDKKMLERWNATLKTWQDFKPSSIKSMPSFIEKNLSPLDLKKEIIFTGEEDVTLLISSGVLLNFLVENPNSSLAPEILYWLSLAEHRMGQTYFFSLGDIYLKDCIRKYPSSPYAKKCYQEYADSLEAGYTGSAGTDIPVSEKRELVKLKSLLK